MSVNQTNATIKKEGKGTSIRGTKKKIKPNPPQTKKVQNNDSKIIDKKGNIKVDYNSNNYFYNEDDNDLIYKKLEFYDINKKGRKYKNETYDSAVEQEDGPIKYMSKNYVEYKGASPSLYNNKKIDYYGENSEDSENNYNNVNYENEDDYRHELKNNKSTIGYKKYQGINKYYLTQDNNEENNKIKRNNQNVISRAINHQINYTKDIKRKGRTPVGNLHNCGNNTTTTNNTYNNNIYYINPINVKNKNKNKKEDINNKIKRVIANKKNSVYKNVDLTINKKKQIKKRDYFKINNIDRSQRQKYINAAILIQSIFRGYLIKIKLYYNVNLYVCCKRSIAILEKLILKRKRNYWKYFRSIISHMFYNDLLKSKVSLSILKEYLRTNKNDSKEKKMPAFHKELGDSFNIVVDRKLKENNEKKLKSKLNDVIKENKELKNQLSDNKNIEEKMKNLIDENKKNKNINDIIMKDNQQLAKKLKDLQDYRNTNLFVEYQPSVDLTQKQQMQIEELIKNNEINLNKLKEYVLEKIVNKKIEKNKYIIKENFKKFRNCIENIKKKDDNKNLHLKNCLNNIENKFRLIKQKYFWSFYYLSIILNNEIHSKNALKKGILKNIINNKQKKLNFYLNKAFFKYYSIAIKSNIENEQKKEEEQEKKNKEQTKNLLLNKIIKRTDKNKKLIYKIFLEKWCLKSKILGMRAAARDKKKKRKLKKKNNRLLNEKHFGIANKQNNQNNLGLQFSKSIQEFSYIVSNGTVIKESSSNNNAEINVKNIKTSTSSDKIKKYNKLDKNKNMGMKKINSVNEMVKQKKDKKEKTKEDNKENENINANEESEEDSGDTFGLEDNNSD